MKCFFSLIVFLNLSLCFADPFQNVPISQNDFGADLIKYVKQIHSNKTILILSDGHPDLDDDHENPMAEYFALANRNVKFVSGVYMLEARVKYLSNPGILRPLDFFSKLIGKGYQSESFIKPSWFNVLLDNQKVYAQQSRYSNNVVRVELDNRDKTPFKPLSFDEVFLIWGACFCNGIDFPSCGGISPEEKEVEKILQENLDLLKNSKGSKLTIFPITGPDWKDYDEIAAIFWKIGKKLSTQYRVKFFKYMESSPEAEIGLVVETL